MDGQVSDAQAHGVLLAAARARVAEGADFTIASLLTGSGISRAQFRRCFTGKKQLLDALTRADVKGLGEILEAAQPAVAQEPVLRAVGSDVTPSLSTPAPTTDAWLERRLRVFERALTGLEKRQEKSEQTLGQQLAVLEEKLGVLAATRAVPLPERAVPAFDPADANLLPADPAPAGPTQADLTQADLAPALLAHVEEIAALNENPVAAPVTEKEMADFIAHARQVARSAVPAEPGRKSRRRRRPVWDAIVLTSILMGGLMLIGATLLLAGGVLNRAGAAPLAARHRQIAQTGLERVIALADSGDADAQTALALAYLRGSGVASDPKAARRWSVAAAMQGQPVAQYLLGTLEQGRDQGAAMRWFRAAALQGNVKAMHNIAIAYAEGLGVAQDSSVAVQWFQRAASLDYRDSQFDLAVLYERGMGVPQSGAAALKWYLIAAGNGDAPSAARAAVLKSQVSAGDVRSAEAQAASFVPEAAPRFANTSPNS